MRCARQCRSRRRGDLHRNKSRHGIPAQPAVARQAAPRKQLARRQPIAPRSHRHQSWPAIALGNDPLLFFQCPTASSARRDHFQSGDLRSRCMVSHTPMSSSSVAPRKVAFAGAIQGAARHGHTVGPVVADMEKLTGVEARRIQSTKGTAATITRTGSGSGSRDRFAASRLPSGAR